MSKIKNVAAFSDSVSNHDIRDESNSNSEVRKKLGSFYALDGQLPPAVQRKLSAQLSNPSLVVKEHRNEDDEKKVLLKIMNDNKLTPKQKESIAASVLRGGTYPVDKKYMNSSDNMQVTNFNQLDSYDLSLVLNRHNLRKPQFLQVVSEKSIIEPLQNSQFRFQRPIASFPLYKSASSVALVKNENPVANSAKTQLIAEAKRKLIQQTKEDALNSKISIQEFKQTEKENILKRIEIKKKMIDFRQVLKEHLQQQQMSQVGNIMRCVTDEMIYHFMQKYDGFSMSIDAIVSLIGNKLGSSTVSPHPDVNIATVQRFLAPVLAEDEYDHKQYVDPSQHLLNEFESLPFRERTYTAHKVRSAPERVLASGFRMSSPPKLKADSIMFSESSNKFIKYSSSSLDSREEKQIADDEILDAMNVMREQLLLEKTLPSLRPEKVLTVKQLEDIGLRRRSIEQISRDIFKKKSQVAKRGVIAQVPHQWAATDLNSISSDDGKISEDGNSNNIGADLQQHQGLRSEKSARDPGIFFNTSIEEGTNNGSHSPNDKDFEKRSEQWDFDRVNALRQNASNSLPLYGSSIPSPVERGNMLERQNLSTPIRELQNQITKASKSNRGDMSMHTSLKSRSQYSADGSHHTAVGLGLSNSVRSENTGLAPILQAPRLLAAPPPEQTALPVMTDRVLLEEEKAKAPRAIKTRSGALATTTTTIDLFNTELPEANHPDGLPASPFKTFNEKTKVYTNGIPSSAGLRLWRPRHKVTKDGRYKVAIASKLRDDDYHDVKTPFFN